ncbi:MAG: alpha-amylase [Gammaproteobacteria bacterium]|nr:alpha-amylase [Gammaproteobacteria bacterium]
MKPSKQKESSGSYLKEVRRRLHGHLELVYPEQDLDILCDRFIRAMGLDIQCDKPRWHKNNWNEEDIAVITYANSFLKEGEKPLATLQRFLTSQLESIISWVHILPFFPFSSDDGFAVINYAQVNEAFGDWGHVGRIGKKFKLMADLVINHCSSVSPWFEQFKGNRRPGKDYFLVVDKDYDISKAVRPRTSPILREVQTLDGVKNVWCTFSHDQPDLNFRNTAVLVEMIKIIRLYLEKGVRIFRLDAVAFLWKEEGTSCLNLDQTHEIVRMIRTLVEYHTPGAVIITETNIPNIENISYFGNANEAHLVYNFSLPPLLLNTLLNENCHALKSWIMGMPPAQRGTTFFNFLASHDGIGLRPLEGFVDDEELGHLMAAMEDRGGRISWRSLESGESKPYEINISLFDALKGTMENPEDGMQEVRFICAHAIMLAIEGVPAFYIHSLVATGNDYEKFTNTNNNRALNRHTWDVEKLEQLLEKDSHHSRVFAGLKRLIEIRKQQKAFHPNAFQFTLHLGDEVFAFWRQSLRRDQCIFCLNNITSKKQQVLLSELNLTTEVWSDLVSGEVLKEGQTTLSLDPYQTVWLTNKA